MRFPRSAVLESIRPAHRTSFLVRRFLTSHFPFVWHFHPEIELTWIERGRGLRFVGSSIEQYADSDLVLIGPDVPHTWQSRPTRGGTAAIVVQFLPRLWGDTFEGLPEMAAIRPVLAIPGRAFRIPRGNLHDQVVRSMQAMSETGLKPIERLLLLLRCLDQLGAGGSSLQPLASVDLHAASNATGQATRLRRVIEELHRSIGGGTPLSQSEAAALAGMSPAVFSRFFRSRVGRTYSRYVNEWRVELACRRLLDGNEPITTIAFDCGFGNLSNFNRRFRQIKGTTPRQFRSLASTDGNA